MQTGLEQGWEEGKGHSQEKRWRWQGQNHVLPESQPGQSSVCCVKRWRGKRRGWNDGLGQTAEEVVCFSRTFDFTHMLGNYWQFGSPHVA